MRGAMLKQERARIAGPGAAVSALVLAGTLALAALAPAPPALAAAPLPEKLGDCVDYKASGDGTVLFNRCNVDLTVRYCCTGPNVHSRWRCAGGRAERKGAHRWLPATAQGRLPQTHPMACDAEAGWRRAACAVQDGAFGANLGPYNWNGRRSDPGMTCTDPQTAGASDAEAPTEDAGERAAAPAEGAAPEAAEKEAAGPVEDGTRDALPEERAAARPAPQEAAKPPAEPNLAPQNPLWIQQWLARLGFDPGPLDGVAGAQTRAALRRWQAAHGYPATGVLTAEQALVLGGLKPAPNAASGKASNTAPADRTADRTAPKEAAPPAGADLNPKCADMGSATGEKGVACWQEMVGRPGCHAWNDDYRSDSKARWTGPCPNGVAHGQGTYSEIAESTLSDYSVTGPFVNGKGHGQFVGRDSKGNTWESSVVNHKLHGRTVIRQANGTVTEGSYANDKRHGRWVDRLADGNRMEYDYRNGSLEGQTGVFVTKGGERHPGRWSGGCFRDREGELRAWEGDGEQCRSE